MKREVKRAMLCLWAMVFVSAPIVFEAWGFRLTQVADLALIAIAIPALVAVCIMDGDYPNERRGYKK